MSRPHFTRIAKDTYVRTDDIVMVLHEHAADELGITLIGGKYFPVTEFTSASGLLATLPRRGDFVEINFDVFLRADVINFISLDPKTGLVGVDTTFGQYFQAPVFQTPEGLLRAIGGEV